MESVTVTALFAIGACILFGYIMASRHIQKKQKRENRREQRKLFIKETIKGIRK